MVARRRPQATRFIRLMAQASCRILSHFQPASLSTLLWAVVATGSHSPRFLEAARFWLMAHLHR